MQINLRNEDLCTKDVKSKGESIDGIKVLKVDLSTNLYLTIRINALFVVKDVVEI